MKTPSKHANNEASHPRKRLPIALLQSPHACEGEKAQLDQLVRALRTKRRIIVIAGAGISTSAGIPDFQSSGDFFKAFGKRHKPRISSKQLFDASLYRSGPYMSAFHDMVRKLSELTKAAKPTAFHHLLATLARENRLMRLYTQNIDGIDTRMSLLGTTFPLSKNEDGNWPKTVQLHGGLDKMVCSKCHEVSDLNADLFDGPDAPLCSNCVELDRVRTMDLGKRSHGVGRLRPRILLYNEHNPDDEAVGAVIHDDISNQPDAVIVVGTSLRIPSVKRVVKVLCAAAREQVDGLTAWINTSRVPCETDLASCWDIVIRGTSDEVARLATHPEHDGLGELIVSTAEEWHLANEKKISGISRAALQRG